MSTLSIAQITTTWQKTIDRIDIELILAFVLQKERSFIIAHPEYIPQTNEYRMITIALQKRMNHIPLAYITKCKEFYGRSFHVTHDTLVPRPETELYISLITHMPMTQLRRSLIIDIGTGSGVIAITLALELKKILHNNSPQIIGTDISPHALRVAKKNAKLHHVEDHISFLRSDLLCDQRLRRMIKETKNDMIITANLPYVDITQKKYLLVQNESIALQHEPSIALWAKDGGLHYYKRLTRQVLRMKKIAPEKKFHLLYEIVPDQMDPLETFMHKYAVPQKSISVTYDIAHKPRIFSVSI